MIESLMKRSPFAPLIRADFDSLLQVFLGQTMLRDDPAIALIYAVLAIGCRLVKKQCGDIPSIGNEAQQYMSVALGFRGILVGGKPTVIKVQVLIVLVIPTDSYVAFGEGY
jgi:hypothetical protein